MMPGLLLRRRDVMSDLKDIGDSFMAVETETLRTCAPSEIDAVFQCEPLQRAGRCRRPEVEIQLVLIGEMHMQCSRSVGARNGKSTDSADVSERDSQTGIRSKGRRHGKPPEDWPSARSASAVSRLSSYSPERRYGSPDSRNVAVTARLDRIIHSDTVVT